MCSLDLSAKLFCVLYPHIQHQEHYLGFVFSFESNYVVEYVELICSVLAEDVLLYTTQKM